MELLTSVLLLHDAARFFPQMPWLTQERPTSLALPMT
jgi:hypothetical protein